MEHVSRLAILILMLVVVQANAVLLVLATQDVVPPLRLEMTHVDSLLPPATLHSPERLRRAVDKSIRRAQRLAGQAKLARTQTFPQASPPASSSPPVYSSDNGAYLVKLALGTPPQSFNGILDTGSDLVWRQSRPCLQCSPEPDPLFDPSNSSTYNNVSCSAALCNALPPPPSCVASVCYYIYSYDGSTTAGILSHDTLTVGSSCIDAFVFGAVTDNYGDISEVATDGIIGMGGGPLSLVSQWNTTIENKFSYCLVAWEDAPSTTSPLLFGSSAQLLGPNVVSTPLITSSLIPTFYYLGLNGISFNGELLNIPPDTFKLQADGSGGLIIDSGTTVAIFFNDGYTPIKDAYINAITLPRVNDPLNNFDLCYNNSGNATMQGFPLLTFHFDGADVEPPLNNIFVQVQTGILCLAFIGIDPIPGFDINVFGNRLQQNFHILFDKGPANQLSLQPTNCEAL